MQQGYAAVLTWSQKATDAFLHCVISYRWTCSSSCFIVVLVPEDANRRSWSFWEEAISSLSLSSKAVFMSRTQCSDWRCCSSNSCSCKITVRIHSSQVSLYREKSAAAEEFRYCGFLHRPSSQRTVIISSTFKPSLLPADEHNLCYFTTFTLASPIPLLMSCSTVGSTGTAPSTLLVTCDIFCIHLLLLCENMN